MEKGILEKTGKPLDHWIRMVQESGIEKHGAIMKHLKSEYAFSHGYANFVALKARKSDAASMDEETLLKNQYQGKEHLIPVYKKLMAKIDALGSDITKTPKKDSVSVIRKKQFVLIKPATKSRMDLGLKLKGKPVSGRLENSGPFGTMCSHRVKLSNADDVDAELIAWIKEAYEMAG
ncbi:MAG: DUF4287 domain-containing protein [Cyclobacteriaceae bacterium]|nr:DUF4287 domain-containing protein [Cyclobacteriaceae bacterium]